MTDEDRACSGSRSPDVRAALFANPYQRIWGAAGEPPLPGYAITLRNVGARVAARFPQPAGVRTETGFRRFLNPADLRGSTASARSCSRRPSAHNGGFVIHLNHPTWRNDPCNPSGATRV